MATLVDIVVAGILDHLEVSRSPAPPRGPTRRSNSGARHVFEPVPDPATLLRRREPAGMTEKTELPLFPLHTVLFPGGPVPLRVFETRYLDMVSSCLKGEGDFGVILIEEGSETGPVSLHETGTVARIRDWYQGSDGILGLTVVGERRFRLQSVARQHDGLNVARVRTRCPSLPKWLAL